MRGQSERQSTPTTRLVPNQLAASGTCDAVVARARDLPLTLRRRRATDPARSPENAYAVFRIDDPPVSSVSHLVG